MCLQVVGTQNFPIFPSSRELGPCEPPGVTFTNISFWNNLYQRVGGNPTWRHIGQWHRAGKIFWKLQAFFVNLATSNLFLHRENQNGSHFWPRTVRMDSQFGDGCEFLYPCCLWPKSLDDWWCPHHNWIWYCHTHLPSSHHESWGISTLISQNFNFSES